jgi:hypothetical protein
LSNFNIIAIKDTSRIFFCPGLSNEVSVGEKRFLSYVVSSLAKACCSNGLKVFEDVYEPVLWRHVSSDLREGATVESACLASEVLSAVLRVASAEVALSRVGCLLGFVVKEALPPATFFPVAKVRADWPVFVIFSLLYPLIIFFYCAFVP